MNIMNVSKPTNERGFTLAEVLVATFIIVVGLVALASGFQFATSGVATGRGETVASFLAEQRLEQLKAIAMTNYYGPPAGSGMDGTADAGRWHHHNRVLPDHQHRGHGHELPGDRDHRGGVLHAHHADHGQPGRHRLHRGGSAGVQANLGQRDLSTGDDPRRRQSDPFGRRLRRGGAKELTCVSH